MTKSTSPPANAALPAIDRRSLVCGLGTAAIAGVPALASAASTSDDPVFQAMAALEQLKIHAEEPDAAHSVAEDAIFDVRKENFVTLDGEEMRTLIRIRYIIWKVRARCWLVERLRARARRRKPGKSPSSLLKNSGFG